MPLRAVFDDSGTNDGSPICVLGGFVCDADSWQDFSVRWENALATDPPIELFKMHEANGFEGQFKGWSLANRDRKSRLLFDIINEYDVHGFGFSLRLADYNATFGASHLNGINPYSVLFHKIILSVPLVCGASQSNMIDFVFDEQGRVGEKAAAAFRMLMAASPERLRGAIGGPPIFRNDRSFVPLQTADAMAWSFRRIQVEPDFGLAKLFKLALSDKPITVHGVSKKELQKQLENVIEVVESGIVGYLLDSGSPNL